MAISEERRDTRQNLWIGNREKAFINSIQSEFIENIVRQSIRYFIVDEQATANKKNIYNESKDKVVSKIFEIFARVNLALAEIVTDSFSIDRKQTIEVYAQRDRAYIDLGFAPQIGDFIEYDKKVFEVTSVNDDINNFGNTTLKTQIIIKGTLARESNIKIDTENLQIFSLDFTEKDFVQDEQVPFQINGTTQNNSTIGGDTDSVILWYL